MSVYYTKCGRKFNKDTNAATTGYLCETNPDGTLIDGCRLCGFSQTRRKNEQIVYECIAGSNPPNFMNTLLGNLSDMNALRIYSLNLNFCMAVFEHAEADPDLLPYFCKDSSDCRKVISVSCSKNKNGIAAKKKFAERFFCVRGE